MVFTPVLTDDRKAVEINLELAGEERKRIRFTHKAYNGFLDILVKAMGFGKGKGVDLEWVVPDDDKLAYYDISLSERPDTGKRILDKYNLGQIVNQIIELWEKQPNPFEVGSWKHNLGLSPMKFVWINEFFQRLASHLRYRTKVSKKYDGRGEEYWDEIRDKVNIEADRYMPRYRTIGGKETLVDEGSVCDDPQLILGLLLSNWQYLEFDDCIFDGFEDMVYVRNLSEKCEGGPCSYHPIEVVWMSVTHRLDNHVMRIPDPTSPADVQRREERFRHWPNSGQRRRDLNGNLLAFEDNEFLCRAWIVKEATFCGKYRLAARKVVINRNKDDFIVTTGIIDLDEKGTELEPAYSKKDTRDLLATIFGKSDSGRQKKLKAEHPEMGPEQMWEYYYEGSERKADESKPIMPLSPRELPITDKGLELIASKILNYDGSEGKSDKEKKDAAAELSLTKHRLSAKLIEIGQFLGWWNDLSEVFVEKGLFSKDVSGKYHPDLDCLGEPWYDVELPLRILGDGVRTLFGTEYDHEERMIVPD